MLTRVLIAIAALVIPTSAFALLYVQSPQQLYIFEAGTYSATRVSQGKPLSVAKPKLIRATTNISARLNVRFGLRYVVTGTDSSLTKLTMVTRYPGAGIRDHVSSELVSFSEYTIDVPVGREIYRDFVFDDQSELVSGEWTFEFWADGRKLGEQTFCVSVPGEQPPVCAQLLG
ncbi:MAG: DUF3859 domain-containing protein [Pseudomonadota bacterium]